MAGSTTPPPEPLRSLPTPYGVLADAIGERAALKAYDALVVHMARRYAGGDAPGMVLVGADLRFTQLRRPGA